MIDRGGGLEILDRAKKLDGNRFGISRGVKVLPPMVMAERRIAINAKQAAAAAAGGLVLATIVLGEFFGHFEPHVESKRKMAEGGGVPPAIFARVSFQASLSPEISQEWIPGDLRAHFPQEWILKGLRERTRASPPNLPDAIAALADMSEDANLLRRNGCARRGGVLLGPATPSGTHKTCFIFHV